MMKDVVDINGFDDHHCLNFLFINDVNKIEGCDIMLFWCLIAHQKPHVDKIYPALNYNGATCTNPTGFSNAFADLYAHIY